MSFVTVETTTTVNTGEVLSFDFKLHKPSSEPGYGTYCSSLHLSG
ncbi:MAG: hypothetical protein JWM59_4480 [Verrucomicrobiales bacterium]|nr:hypothetical protein [Verrucomicrobiales bacterium]